MNLTCKSLFVIAIAAMLACNNTEGNTTATNGAKAAATDTAAFTSIQWIDSLKNIGNVPKGETVQIAFSFKNTGTYPLFIISAEPGCGCTLADYPKEAIAPGGTGTITAAFDTNQGSEGEFRKNIMVTTNTKEQPNQILYFSGTIVNAAGEKQSAGKS